MIQDSGNRREFESGAVRDIAEGKGRCDLLPLGVIAIRESENIFANIDHFIRKGDPSQLYFAIEHMQDKLDWDTPTMLLELSKHYEDGCLKYGERNWEKGIPLHCFIDSGVRHYLKFLRGDTDERHDRAFFWNMFGAIWTYFNHPECNDLPFADKKE